MSDGVGHGSTVRVRVRVNVALIHVCVRVRHRSLLRHGIPGASPVTKTGFISVIKSRNSGWKSGDEDWFYIGD